MLRCIRRHIADHGEAPTVRQIGQAVGMRGRASVHYWLVELAAKSAIVREPGRTRGIPAGRPGAMVALRGEGRR
ncbi:LexA family protein [Streptomyces eurythermus]|uniref:LexA family protein n=1 Tax=Streptomyces eurythermus TaxID=42237 RepID=UPI0037020ECA